MNEDKSVMARAAPLPPPAPDLSIVVPPKPRKGRSPKNQDLMPVGENIVALLAPKPDGRRRKPKRKIGDMAWPAADSIFVGQQVHGVLDGSFDAGYLLTVRVGNTPTVLRGAVFEPALSVPISEANDIAPHVKFITRSEQMVCPLSSPEKRPANPFLPPSAGSSMNLVGTEIACVPSEVVSNKMAPLLVEEDRPAEALSLKPSLMPAVATAEYFRDSTSFLTKDHGTEKKINLQSEQQSQQDVTGKALVY